MDEIVREKLELVFRKCILISTRTKADVFFNYSPHTNMYSVNYHLKGYHKDPNNCVEIDSCSYTELKILEKTLDELDKLWEKAEKL